MDEFIVFEGMTSISSVLNSPEFNDRKIIKILYDKERREKRSKDISFLRYNSDKYGYSIEESSNSVISEYAKGNTHGGIIALCTDRTIRSIDESEIKHDGYYLVLDGIEDPFNFGYSIRSAYLFGCDGIIVNERNWMNAAGTVSRSSAGTSEKIQIYTYKNTSFIERFKETKYSVVCAGIRNSKTSDELSLKKPILLIIGGEKRGISSSLLDKADDILRIDYSVLFSGSLPTTSTVSILSYEINKKNKAE